MTERKANKGAVITKLVLWSVVAVILIAMFAVLMVAGNTEFTFGFDFINMGYNDYGDDGDYNAGNKKYGEEIKNLEIYWTNGEVNFVIREGEGIEIAESGAGEREDYKMRSRVEGDTLEVRFVKSGLRMDSLPEKELTVYISPSVAMSLGNLEIKAVNVEVKLGDKDSKGNTGINCKDITVDCVSASLDVFGVNAESFEVNALSADVVFDGKAKKLSLEGLSGNLNANGEIDKLEVAAISSNVSLELVNTPGEINVSGVSSNVSLTLPESSWGFEAELESVSGKITFNSENTGGYCKYGEGEAEYSFENVSGEVVIKTKKVSE